MVRLLTIFSIITLWIIYAPSHFQKGGVDSILYWLVPGIIFSCSIIWVSSNTFKLIEKVLLAGISSFLSLLVSTFFIAEQFIKIRYSDKTWFLWDTDERLIMNAVYYGTTILLVIISIELYILTKNKIQGLY